jgi:hypothetical protein
VKQSRLSINNKVHSEMQKCIKKLNKQPLIRWTQELYINEAIAHYNDLVVRKGE